MTVKVDVAGTTNYFLGHTLDGSADNRINTNSNSQFVAKFGGALVNSPTGSVVSGRTHHIKVVASADKISIIVDGKKYNSQQTPDLSLVRFNSIAADIVGPKLNGVVYDYSIAQASPMQDVTVMSMDDTAERWASIPEITFTGDYRIGQWFSSETWGGIDRLFGTTEDLGSPRAYVSGTQVVFVASPTITSPVGTIDNGKDHHIVCERIGTNATIYVNGVSVATTNTASTSTYSINAIGNHNGIYGRGTVSNIEIKDLDTGITHTYNNTDCYEQLSVNYFLGDLTVPSGITDNGDGTFTCDGTQSSSVQMYATGIVTVIGKIYQTEVEIISITAGNVHPRVGNTNGGIYSSVGIFTDESIIPVAASVFGFEVSGNFVGTFRPISVKQATVILPDSTVTEYGDELWVDPVPDITFDWAYNGNGVYEKSGVISGGVCGYVNGSSGAPLADTMYRVTANISPTASDLNIFTKDGGSNVAVLTGLTGVIDVVVTAGDEGGLWFAKTAFEGTVSNVSFKEVIAIADTSGEIVTNGEFDTDSDWSYTLNGGTAVIDGGQLTLTRETTGNCEARQTLSGLVVGQEYIISMYVDSTVGSNKVNMFSTDVLDWSPATGLRTGIITATSTTANVTIAKGGSTGTVGVFNSISVKHVDDSTDGKWVNATMADLEYLPQSDRFYAIDEGSGDVIRDTLNPETELWSDNAGSEVIALAPETAIDVMYTLEAGKTYLLSGLPANVAANNGTGWNYSNGLLLMVSDYTCLLYTSPSPRD